MRLAIIALAATFAVSGCALKKKEGYSVADSESNPDLICERVPVPGKVYPGKICMTEAQWARHHRAGKDTTTNMQQGALRTPAPGGNGG